MACFSWGDGASGFVEADGIRLEAASFGPSPAQAPTIVLLHEGLGSVALWRDFPARLAKATGFGVFAYSRAGYGQSDPTPLPRPLDYMTREATGPLVHVLDAIGFRRGVLFGHSDGASIALIYAGSVEDFRVRGLVLIAPHLFTEPSGLGSIAEAKRAYDEGDLKPKLAKYHRNVDNAFRGWNDAWLDPGFEAWNIADCVDYIRVPMLVVQGADDQYGTVAQVREIEARSYAPVDVEIFDGCRHSPHIECPERLLDSVKEFCARLDRIERAEVEMQ